MAEKQVLPDKWILDLVFSYDENTGNLFWDVISKENADKLGWSNKRYLLFISRFAGKKAGHEFTTSKGPRLTQVRFDGKSYYLHRIIWKIIHGYDCHVIDHIDGNPLNNRACNLRDVSSALNSKNCKKSSTNNSGYTGVCWSNSRGKWEAYIWNNYRKYNLGLFTDIEDAISARKAKEVEFGYHKNHGR